MVLKLGVETEKGMAEWNSRAVAEVATTAGANIFLLNIIFLFYSILVSKR